MMITRKTRLITVGLAVLVLFLLLLWLWFVLRPKSSEPEPAPVATPEQLQIPEEAAPTLTEELLKKEQAARNESAGVTTVSKMFVERYGSYSNEAKFQNLIDVFPLMTEAFVNETRALIDESIPPETYYGVTTRALTVEVEAMDESAGVATVQMQTQREIAQGSTQNTSITYQEIRLKLEKEAGVWKVSSADWL
jgi:hypothetical protein